jgi:hypothetical protein
MNLARYAELTDDVEIKLDEADRAAETSNIRHTHKQVFSRLKKKQMKKERKPQSRTK